MPDTIGYTLHGNRYLNITAACTLRCAFCPKFNKVWEVQGYDLKLGNKEGPSVQSIIEAVGDPTEFNEIVFCGLGESTLRWNVVLEVARQLKSKGAKTIRLNTDGLANLVHERDVTPEMKGLIDAVSISMNAQNEEIYNKHCRPKKDYRHLQEVRSGDRLRPDGDQCAGYVECRRLLYCEAGQRR